MNRVPFRVALAAAIAASALIPAGSAGAATTKHPPTAPLGTIKVCSAHAAKVYADGPSSRVDDLATFYKSGECTHWDPVLPGNYEVGFAWRSPAPHGSPLLQCVVKRRHKKVYKVFNGQGVVKTNVVSNELTEIDLFDYRG
jgi:hypothetical protein